MILHTIIPPEQIFPGEGGAAYDCVEMNNSFIQGVSQGGRFTVTRLISTDPRLYLDPRYAPGGRLSN